MTHDRAAHLQLDLFKVQIAPCGRSSAPTCWLEHNPPAGCWTCSRCGCIAPGHDRIPRLSAANARRESAIADNASRSAFSGTSNSETSKCQILKLPIV
jgi:hypothetical protein